MSVLDVTRGQTLGACRGDVWLTRFAQHAAARESRDETDAWKGERDRRQDQMLHVTRAPDRQEPKVVADSQDEDQSQPETGYRDEREREYRAEHVADTVRTDAGQHSERN